jgi:D-alanine-D-alanine ligase-like ATP-grasp enzyme
MKQTVQYLLVIILAPAALFDCMAELRRQTGRESLRLLILTPNPSSYDAYEDSDACTVVHCDFSQNLEIEAALAPFRKDIVGVICRGDKRIQYLRRVLPFLPADVLVSTPESLQSATNKSLMRADFRQHYPEITPRFIEVFDAAPQTVTRVEEALAYPVIIKPANLASSLLIQSCHTRAQLTPALRSTFEGIKRSYEKEDRHDVPQVIVEEYLEGDFYSIDAYVQEPGQVTCLPAVAYVPAKQLGIDDFYLYKRFLPTMLSDAEVAAANETTAKAIAAVGLTHTTVHIELVFTKDGWKVIELGPRIGNFRHIMYEVAYAVNHTFNDALVHLGKPPQVTPKFREYCATYSIYPERDGILQELTHLDFLYDNPAVRELRVHAEPGMGCLQAKHGGHTLADFVISTPDKREFDKLTTYIEANIKAQLKN